MFRGVMQSGAVGGCAAGYGAILRRAYEHFNEVVVETVVDLALKIPGELRVVEVAWMDREHILMNWDGRVFQIDENLDGSAGFAGRKRQQWMNVEAEVVENFGKLRGIGHGNIVVEVLGIRSVAVVQARGRRLVNPASANISRSAQSKIDRSEKPTPGEGYQPFRVRELQ
jgi:hypothetical protein